MPNEDQIKIMIDPTVLMQVDAVCPSYLSRTAFINQAVDLYLKGIDTVCYPFKQPTAEALEGSRPNPFNSKEIKNLRKEEINQPRAAEAVVINKERARDLYKTKQLNPDLIPGDLLDVQQLLPEWWAVKKGVRSEGVFNRVCKALRGMTPEDRRTCLERATSGAWANIYEPSSTPTQGRQNHQAAPEFVHPAHRVFSNGQFEDEKDWPESKTGGKGVLDI